MTHLQFDATTFPNFSPQARPLCQLEPNRSAATAPEGSPTATIALKSRLMGQFRELNEDARDCGEPEVSESASKAALNIAFLALTIHFGGPTPAVFSNDAGGAVITFQNRNLRRRLSVEIPAEASRYVVTATSLSAPLSGEEPRLLPAQPPNLKKWLQWVCANTE